MNYLSTSTKAYIKINKAVPEVIKLPTTSLGYEGDTLEEIDLIDGEFNVKGSFIWKNINQELIVGEHEYEVKFIPDDENNYENYQMNISVSTISYEETLRRIKADREETFSDLEGIIDENLTIDNLKEINNLPVIGENYQSSITWYSSNNIINVDQTGNINYLDKEGIYSVTLIG